MISNQNRVVLGNLILKVETQYLMINLYSFRRRNISEIELILLYKIDSQIKSQTQLSLIENEFYALLVSEKQIFCSDIIEKADEIRKSEKLDNNLSITSIVINLSYMCNFNCTYCYQRDFSNKNEYIDVSKVKKIIEFLDFFHSTNNIIRLKLQSVTISGGEPLIERNIDSINYILNNIDSEHFTLYTNGVNILKYKNKIDYSRFDKVQISLDGMENTFLTINNSKNNAFSQIVKSIKYLVSICMYVEISTILTLSNIDELKNMFTYFESEGFLDIKNLKFNISHVTDFRSNNSIDSKFYTLDQYISLTKYVTDNIVRKNIHLKSAFEVRWIKQILNRSANTQLWGRTHACNVENSRDMLFGPNGKIYWCTVSEPTYGIFGEYYPEYKMDLSKYKNMLNRTVYAIKECSKCCFRFVCNGGCPLYKFSHSDDVFSPFCGLFKDEFFLDNLERFIF